MGDNTFVLFFKLISNPFLFFLSCTDFYEGIFCQIDADCNDYLGVCHEGRCALPSLEKVSTTTNNNKQQQQQITTTNNNNNNNNKQQQTTTNNNK